MESAFWMVWSPQGNPPTTKHPTPDIAKAEAERLFRQFKHQDFYVLEAISKVRFKPEEKPIEHVGLDNMPF